MRAVRGPGSCIDRGMLGAVRGFLGAIHSSRLDPCYSLTPPAPVGNPARSVADTASIGRRPRVLVTDPDFPPTYTPASPIIPKLKL